MRTLRCLRCQSQMDLMQTEYVQLGKTTLLRGAWPNVWAGAMKTDIYICSTCRKMEFYLSEEEKTGELPQKECPRCGRKMDFDMPKCPSCGYGFYE